MRVRRGLLFWGLLLIPLGAIPLLVRAGQLDPNRLIDVWRLWPLVIIGIGIAILASRTRFGLIGTAIVALAIGLIGGTALASGNIWLGAVTACGVGNEGSTAVDKSGTFGGPATIRLQLDCGTVDFRAGETSTWSVHASYRGDPPSIDGSQTGLDVRTPSGGPHRQDWTVAAPASSVTAFQLTANAASSTVDLGSAALDDLQANVNAGDVRIMAGSGAIKHADLTMNAGRLRLTLGGGAPTTGKLSVNAGAIDVCVPPDVGLRLDVQDQLTFITNLSSRGLSRNGSVWTRAATGSAQTIGLSVEGNAASFTLDPNGGC